MTTLTRSTCRRLAATTGWMSALILAVQCVAVHAEKQKIPSVLILDPAEKNGALSVSGESRLVVHKGTVIVNSTHSHALSNQRATIEVLDGSIGTLVKIGFYYKADKEFTLIGEKTADFGEEVGPDVTRVVELRWKGKPTRTVDIFDNIQVRIDPDDRINESAEDNNMGFAGAWFGAKEEDEGGLGGPSPSGFEVVVLVAALLPALMLVRELKKRRES